MEIKPAKKRSPKIFWIGASVLATALCFFLIYGLLFAYDHILTHQHAPSSRDLRKSYIATLDFYPYTGFHMQPDTHHTLFGQDIHSGGMGFWSPDFDILNPPPKAKDEFRILLIGGSGAQGQAPDGISDATLFYKKLGESLAGALPGKKIRVINFAMGGTQSYQNFIALNLWGHRLEPDFILSYSGFNEWHVPINYEHLPDAYMGYSELNAISLATREDAWPPSLEWLPSHFPGIAFFSPISVPLKLLLGMDYFRREARERYRRARNFSSKTDWEMLRTEVMPFYVETMKSIKRDFEGIPIMIAWQVVDSSDIEIFLRDSDRSLPQDFYQQMFQSASQELRGYRNAKWYFVDTKSLFQDPSFKSPSYHLRVMEQARLAESLGIEIRKLLPAIKK